MYKMSFIWINDMTKNIGDYQTIRAFSQCRKLFSPARSSEQNHRWLCTLAVSVMSGDELKSIGDTDCGNLKWESPPLRLVSVEQTSSGISPEIYTDSRLAIDLVRCSACTGIGRKNETDYNFRSFLRRSLRHPKPSFYCVRKLFTILYSLRIEN